MGDEGKNSSKRKGTKRRRNDCLIVAIAGTQKELGGIERIRFHGIQLFFIRERV